MSRTDSDLRLGFRVEKVFDCEERAISDLLFIEDDIVFAVCEFQNVICICDRDLKTTSVMESVDLAVSTFSYPSSITAYDKKIYVSDRWNHRIIVLSRAGEFLFSFGKYGEEKGELCEPCSLSFSEEGKLYVVDKGNGRVCVFSRDGNYESSFAICGVPYSFYESERFKRGFHFKRWVNVSSRLRSVETRFYEQGFEVGEIEHPEGSAFDQNGNYYLTDRTNSNIVCYDKSCRFKGFISGEIKDSRFDPVSLCQYDDGVLVADEIQGRLYYAECGFENARKVEVDGFDGKPSNLFFDQGTKKLYICDGLSSKVFLCSSEGR